MEYFNNHRKLFLTAFALFLFLTILVAIVPAINNQNNNKPLPGMEPLRGEVLLGKAIYVENGCVGCHTQQVRNVDMDKVWGSRPGIAADYANNERTDFWRNTATLMGTERTGPDLTNIGNRQPSLEWHLLHLYQPRSVVGQSIMPAYKFLFDVKNELQPGEVEITVPDEFRKGVKGKIVASKKAIQLVSYLQTLKQAKLYDTASTPKFLYKKTPKLNQPGGADGGGGSSLDGKALYSTHCQACHQANGMGLPGAFPPLKGSKIILDDDPQVLVDIIMNGYDARPEYAVMPGVGTAANLSAEEISAIINHERSSWGNSGIKVTASDVKKIMEMVAKK
jgi:cytochrome c oxidase cbb3-type subunit 2